MTSRIAGTILGLLIILIGAAAWIVTTSSKALTPTIISTSTYAKPFAVAEIAKPTYTPLPPPTMAPTQEPTATLQAIAEAVIVDPP